MQKRDAGVLTIITVCCNCANTGDAPQWVEGHELTVDACVEGTTDVVAHTEEWLVAYKRFTWLAQVRTCSLAA